MGLFSKRNDERKLQEVQQFLAKILNNCSTTISDLREGPRGEKRINLTLVALVIPMKDDTPDTDHAFYATTKEISTSGISLVLDEDIPFENLLIGIRWESELKFMFSEIRHREPLGGGFFQIGAQLIESVTAEDYPQTNKFSPYELLDASRHGSAIATLAVISSNDH